MSEALRPTVAPGVPRRRPRSKAWNDPAGPTEWVCTICGKPLDPDTDCGCRGRHA